MKNIKKFRSFKVNEEIFGWGGKKKDIKKEDIKKEVPEKITVPGITQFWAEKNSNVWYIRQDGRSRWSCWVRPLPDGGFIFSYPLDEAPIEDISKSPKTPKKYKKFKSPSVERIIKYFNDKYLKKKAEEEKIENTWDEEITEEIRLDRATMHGMDNPKSGVKGLIGKTIKQTAKRQGKKAIRSNSKEFTKKVLKGEDSNMELKNRYGRAN